MVARLKSLELHGYKTFASRTLFEFSGDITAIVGPNGSGKSNVADSIRWVLGEQSYSLLRGRKTDDMIFAGSELRPRGSMASAVITFDNSDSWLPIDFSEVSIGRRAYRDAQNEYILNSQKVRLKEISELLAQSGLAERTYTIIGQGLVDAALSLKPEERRKFFEEAAGIGLYRSRREEALNRLETTRRNLERVQDILSELEPRLKSLEKQAARAIEYERIKADLRVLLRDWYGYHWHRTQRDVTHAREVVAAQEEKLDLARLKLEEVEKRIQLLREELQSVRSELNEWHRQSAELHNQREKISRDLAVLDERQRALLDQQVTLRADLARLEDEEASRKERLDAMQQEKEQREQAVDEAEAQLADARKALQERQAKREKMISFLRTLRQQLNRSETRMVELRAHQKELSGRKVNLQNDIARIEQTREAAEKAVQESEARQTIAADYQKKLEGQRQSLETETQSAQKDISALEDTRRKLQEQINASNAERSRTKAQMDVLEQAEQSLSGLNQGSKAILHAARQGKIRGKFTALSNLLEIDSQYETALAAVLGEYLDGIALDPQADAEDVLKLLEDGKNGKAVLFPLDDLRADQNEVKSDDPDCLGAAANLVRSDESQKSLIRLLLGKVLVATDRAAARRIAKTQPFDTRVVSLKGEVFYGSGMITAGKEGREAVISRPRQIRELKEKLQSLNEQINKLDEDARKTSEQLNKVQEARKNSERALRELTQNIEAAARKVREATLQVGQARQKLTWQQDQVKTIETQIEATQKELSGLGSEIRKLEGEQESLDLQIDENQKEVDLLPIEQFQSQVNHWNTQLALAERSLNDAGQRISEYRQSYDANINQQKLIRQRLEQSEKSLLELEAQKTADRDQENSLNASMARLQEKIEPGEQRLTNLEARYEQMQGDQTAAQQVVAVADRHFTQAQLELSRVKDSLDSLQRRIEEDFGLVAFEYRGDISGHTPLPLEGMVENLPTIVEIPPDLEENLNRQRGHLRRIGAINPEAQHEYLSVKDRFEFLTAQVGDLRKADEDLRLVIGELDELMKREFRRTFDAVAIQFKEMFTRLFGGGTARLVLVDEENPTEGGIDIEARLPGRREQGLSLLSGGERSLTAVALVFSLLKVSPTPFCVLDEVDAALDEANVGRFCDLLKELSATTQFIVITHNRNTVQIADVVYGITMGKDTASQMISLRLDEVSEEMVK